MDEIVCGMYIMCAFLVLQNEYNNIGGKSVPGEVSMHTKRDGY